MLSPVPETMFAVQAPMPGGPDMLRLVPRPTPRPGPGEVLIRVHAAGVNRADIAQREGRYPPPAGITDILGLEVAGEVQAAGAGVRTLHPGDTVCALVAGGGYAEYCVAPEAHCLPVPSNFDMVQAAALPEAFFTGHVALVERGRLKAGETLLVHGGASGVGTVAIQLGVLMGARVFATAGTPEKVRMCERLGAARAINYRTEDFVEAVRAATDHKGVDVILDMVGGDYVGRNIAAAALEGRIVQLSFLAGATVQVNLQPLMTRRLTLTGSTLRARSAADKAAIAAALKAQVWRHLDSGRLTPVIHATFPLAEAASAHQLMETGVHIGKIVLTAH